MQKDDYIIVKNNKIQNDIFEMEIEVDFEACPGQFVNVDIGRKDLILRRPISISNIKDNRLSIIYRTVGEGTKELATKMVGKTINLLAPLGNGYPLVNNKNVLIIGCGMGVAPMYYLASKLSITNNVTIVLAYSNKNVTYLENSFNDFGNVHIVTDDGSFGFKGNVLEFLEKENISFDTLYACGPNIVLKSLDLKYQGKKEGYLSFEERMACGIGACYGCIIKTKEGTKRVCHDGPVFELGVIDYD